MATCRICGKKALEPSPLSISICSGCYQEGLKTGHIVIKTVVRRVEQPPSRLRQLLLPKYDELSLFLISLLCILICYYDSEFRMDALTFLFQETEGDVFIAIPFLIAGIAYSLYHVFTSRKKTPTEKKLMLFVAVVTNGFSAIVAAIHMFKTTPGILLVFPVINMISGVLLIFLWGCEVVEGDDLEEEATLNKWVSDDNASFLEVLFGTAILVGVFSICRSIPLHWSVTGSICVAYTTGIHGPLQRSLQLLLSKRTVAED